MPLIEKHVESALEGDIEGTRFRTAVLARLLRLRDCIILFFRQLGSMTFVRFSVSGLEGVLSGIRRVTWTRQALARALAYNGVGAG